jgi:hypothetical protein
MSTTQNVSAATPIKFSLKLVEILYNETIYPWITNTKYEGEIKNEGDRVRVRTAGKVTLKNYTKGMALVSDDLTPTAEDLVIDRQSYFKFIVDDIDKLQNDVDTMNEYAKAAMPTMSELIDSELLEYGRRNVAGPNALGTAYAVGTVSIAATTGVVTGTGTTFTAAMVGGYFRAATHPAGRWYIVTAFASGTSITIRDLGNETVYTGGVITGAAYTINAATALALTPATVGNWLVQLNTVLNKSLAPRKAQRWLVVNADLETIIRLSPRFTPAVPEAYSQVVKSGLVGRIEGFEVYFSELVAGNNTTGYWFLAGDGEFMHFAAQIMKVSMLSSDQDPNSFMSTCKGLLVRGFKVFEGNRGRGAVLRATTALS